MTTPCTGAFRRRPGSVLTVSRSGRMCATASAAAANSEVRMRRKERLRKGFRTIGSVAVLFAIGISSALAQSGASKAYELRIYTANAGQLADFQTPFRGQALPL